MPLKLVISIFSIVVTEIIDGFTSLCRERIETSNPLSTGFFSGPQFTKSAKFRRSRNSFVCFNIAFSRDVTRVSWPYFLLSQLRSKKNLEVENKQHHHEEVEANCLSDQIPDDFCTFDKIIEL